MNIDGSNQRQLTEREDNQPGCSPDGRWVVYCSYTDDNRSLWKVPFDGGEPVQLTDYPSRNPTISPDGKLIATTFFDEQGNRERVAIIPFEGGKPARTLDLDRPVDMPMAWATDNRSLLYVSGRTGVLNVWSQARLAALTGAT